MTDPGRIGIPSREEAEALFAAPSDSMDDDPTASFGLTALGAGSSALRGLRTELQSALAALPADSPQRAVLADVLAGRRDLRSALADAATPPPRIERLPSALGEALRDLGLDPEDPR